MSPFKSREWADISRRIVHGHNRVSFSTSNAEIYGFNMYSCFLSSRCTHSISGSEIARTHCCLKGIAPTLIIVRVGLGVSTDDVEKSVLVSRIAGTHPDIENQRGVDPPMELQVRTAKYSEEFQESSNKTQTF